MMQKQAHLILDNQTLRLEGELNFSNVMDIYAKSLSLIPKSPELHFDFSALTSSDSSGLALIMEWLKLAKKQHKQIRFSHLSSDLMSIVKVAGIDDLINANSV